MLENESLQKKKERLNILEEGLSELSERIKNARKNWKKLEEAGRELLNILDL